MSITRPVGEQLTFKSAKTGDHVLDTYLEAVERGTRTLADIVDEIVDSTGDLRTDIFQFRETPAVNGVSSGILQARVGTYVDANAGWANITSSNFATFVTAAQLAKTQAESAKASADADVVLTNADVVLTHADVVLTHADVVLAEADKVQTALDRVATGNDKTATNADVVLTNADVVLAEADKVQTGLDRVATAADVVLTHADVVLAEADKVQTGADRTAAANSATASANSATASANSATASANSATASANSASGASTSATNAAASYDSFDDRYLGAKGSAPTTDNDSNALIVGALYFNTSSQVMSVWNGSAWAVIAPSAANQANVDIVAGNIVYSEDLGSITAAVTTATGSSINVVGGAIANVNTVAGAVANVNTVGAGIANVNTVASSIANVNTVAGSIADVNRYANEYKISSSAPAGPSQGDLWLDTAASILKYYTGSSWSGIISGITSVANDSSPQLGGALDGQNNNMTNIGTISGANLQLDFGGLT